MNLQIYLTKRSLIYSHCIKISTMKRFVSPGKRFMSNNQKLIASSKLDHLPYSTIASKVNDRILYEASSNLSSNCELQSAHRETFNLDPEFRKLLLKIFHKNDVEIPNRVLEGNKLIRKHQLTTVINYLFKDPHELPNKLRRIYAFKIRNYRINKVVKLLGL